MSVEALNEGPPHPPPPGTPRTSRGRDFQPPSRSASAPNGADQQPEAADPDHGESCVKGGELPANHESKSLGVPGYRRGGGGGGARAGGPPPHPPARGPPGRAPGDKEAQQG